MPPLPPLQFDAEWTTDEDVNDWARAYAEQCVRDALERAAKVCEETGEYDDAITCANCAEAIRALMDDKEHG